MDIDTLKGLLVQVIEVGLLGLFVTLTIMWQVSKALENVTKKGIEICDNKLEFLKEVDVLTGSIKDMKNNFSMVLENKGNGDIDGSITEDSEDKITKSLAKVITLFCDNEKTEKSVDSAISILENLYESLSISVKVNIAACAVSAVVLILIK